MPISPVFSDVMGGKAQKRKTKQRVGNMKHWKDGERRQEEGREERVGVVGVVSSPW